MRQRDGVQPHGRPRRREATDPLRAVAQPEHDGVSRGARYPLWVANREDDMVMRVRLRPGRVPALRTIGVADGPVDVAVGTDAVWVANSLDGTVSRVNPATNAMAETIDVGGQPSGIAAGAGFVWMTRRPTPG